MESLQIKSPILVVGLGGAGSRLAVRAGDALGSDCLLISNDRGDLAPAGDGGGRGRARSIHVSTGPVVNPSVRLVRGAAMGLADRIRSGMEGYPTVVMVANLAGRAGAAMAPAISGICRESGRDLVSFAVMPFKYEKDRIFNAGVALKRVREDSRCTIVLDNDAMLESNPDLSPERCYGIANQAVTHVARALGSSPDTVMPGETAVIAASRANAAADGGGAAAMEGSLRDALKMLYADAPPTAIKRSIVYVLGGSSVPAGVLNSVASLANGALNESVSHMDVAAQASDESGVMVLSSVTETTRFDGYDPLGAIPRRDTLDWSVPECSIDCKLDTAMYQME